MLNKKLKAISSLIKKESIILDVGTDHALLPIYLVKNGICPLALASDISHMALKGAQNNIQKYKALNIETYETDGLKNIPKKYDTIILSGMGSRTIINILKDEELPKNLIISSNNDLPLLRDFMNKKGYKIVKEIVIYEKKKYYDIILYEKGEEKLTFFQKEFGKSNDLDYYNHLYQNLQKIYEVTTSQEKLKIKESLKKLEMVIGKKKDY